MKRFIIIAVMAVLMSGTVLADSSVLSDADNLWKAGDFDGSLAVLERALASVSEDNDKAELLWRKARALHDSTSLRKKEGMSEEGLLSIFIEGQEAATESIALNPESPWAFYWRSANIGSWGDTKGILNALDKLPDMQADLAKAIELDSEHGDSWSVLAIVAASVPGFMGGGMDKAVSNDRRAVDCWSGRGEIPWEWYGELYQHLYHRDWSSQKRNGKLRSMARSFDRADSYVDRHEYYEGTVDFSRTPVYADRQLSDLSDREESKAILLWLTEALESMDSRTSYQESKLASYREHLRDWDLP